MVEVVVEGRKFNMEVDCGAAVSVISLITYKRCFENVKVVDCASRLVVVNGQRLNIHGKIQVSVSINNTEKHVILDCANNFMPLLGRNWLEVFFPH